jgi:hypothetical protein
VRSKTHSQIVESLGLWVSHRTRLPLRELRWPSLPRGTARLHAHHHLVDTWATTNSQTPDSKHIVRHTASYHRSITNDKEVV